MQDNAPSCVPIVCFIVLEFQLKRTIRLTIAADKREEAERYLSGGAESFAGRDKLLADLATVRNVVTDSINKELRATGYRFDTMHIDAQEVLDFLSRFTDEKPFVKIGMELFYAAGPDIVKEIRG